MYGQDDDALAADDDAEVASATAELASPTEEATVLLRRMRALAERARRTPDAKVRALFAWLRANMCPAIGSGPDSKVSKKWSDRRVILFTEYADTKRFITELLNEAIEGTDRAEERILSMHGGMGDDARDEVQRKFNTDPRTQPVRKIQNVRRELGSVGAVLMCEMERTLDDGITSRAAIAHRTGRK